MIAAPGEGRMGILDWFRKAPAIASRDALVDFIDTRAAFLIQKNIFDYARARAGPYFSHVVHEAEFKQAVEKSRWTSFPLAIAAVSEMVYGVLKEEASSEAALLDAVSKVAFDVFDKYPVPQAIGEEDWNRSRDELKSRLSQFSLHPTKLVKDIFLPTARAIFDALPIPEVLRKQDYEMVQNQLRINLVTMHDDFEQRADQPALLAALGFVR